MTQFESTFLYHLAETPFPTLDIGTRQGYTSYIDFIDSNEFNTPVVQGVDCHNRPFVCLKMKCTLDSGEIISTYQTYFQRYNDSNHLWVGTSNSEALFDTCGGMRENQKQFLVEILTRKEVTRVPDDMCFCIFKWKDTRKIVKVELSNEIDLSDNYRLVCVGHDDSPKSIISDANTKSEG